LTNLKFGRQVYQLWSLNSLITKPSLLTLKIKTKPLKNCIQTGMTMVYQSGTFTTRNTMKKRLPSYTCAITCWTDSFKEWMKR
jgi:hypothetical protein